MVMGVVVIGGGGIEGDGGLFGDLGGRNGGEEKEMMVDWMMVLVKLVVGLIENGGREIRRWKDIEVEEIGKRKKGHRRGLVGNEEMASQDHRSGGKVMGVWLVI